MSDSPSIWQLIKEDASTIFQKDPAIRSKIELFFNYPGFWTLFNYRIAHWFYLKGLRTLARFIMGMNQILTNIDLHPAATIGRRVFMDHGIGIVIGETAEIGNDVLIYQGVTLGGVSLERKKRHPTVMDGVVIGAGAKVIGDIIIGKNAKIGANSVVVKPVPDDATAIGIPARVITKGRAKGASEINKLPDIDKQLFNYLLKRVAILEKAVRTNNVDFDKEDQELEEIYQTFLNAMKN